VTNGAILAIDYGSKNIGLACSDELGVTVRPLESIPNRSRREAIHRLKSAVEEYRIRHLVVGMPWNMDGSQGEATERMERVMDRLRSELDVPLSPVDERLSTIEANEIWSGMNARQRRRYRTVDSLAAALILERYLREARP
jgi:putative Holliday junction resolvase